jgi:hypothetical protein
MPAASGLRADEKNPIFKKAALKLSQPIRLPPENRQSFLNRLLDLYHAKRDAYSGQFSFGKSEIP